MESEKDIEELKEKCEDLSDKMDTNDKLEMEKEIDRTINETVTLIHSHEDNNTLVNKVKYEDCKTDNEITVVDRDKWGYVVCAATIICFIAGIGHINSLGLLFSEFMNDETHSSAKALTTAHGVFVMMLAVGGFILNGLSKKFSLRVSGFIGGGIMVAGSLATIFVTNTGQLSITIGVLQGIGFGIIVPVTYANINYYFVKKRTAAMSTIKAVQGVLMTWYPHLIKHVLEYGFRPALAMVCGVSLLSLPGIAVMKIDIRRIENPDEAEGEKLQRDRVNKEKTDEQSMVVKSIGWRISSFLNIKLLQDVTYCNICFGQSLVNFSDSMFFVLQPMLLLQYGYDTSQVAWCISVWLGADVAGRFLLALTSTLVSTNTRLLFYIATVLTFIARIVYLLLREFIPLVAMTATLGVLRAVLHITSPLNISNHVHLQDFPSAYALYLLVTGVVHVIGAPLIGHLKDVYGDYRPAFYALTLLCLPPLILWAIEYRVLKNKS